MTEPATSSPVVQSLRLAVTCSLCLLLVSWWNLKHANLAVWTSYMVMAVVPRTFPTLHLLFFQWSVTV